MLQDLLFGGSGFVSGFGQAGFLAGSRFPVDYVLFGGLVNARFGFLQVFFECGGFRGSGSVHSLGG